MRILWLSPSLRNRVQIAADALLDLGAQVMLVTADLHYEVQNRRDYETVLLGRPIPTSDWLPVLRAYREAKRFRPDVVVTEYLRDPRWRIMTQLAPRVRIIHDAEPHDETHIAPWWNRLFFDRWDPTAQATVVFSRHVANRLHEISPNQNVYVAPLHADLDPALLPAFVPANERRDFVLFGRQKPYKNHEVVFAAWEAHVNSSAWTGDQLVLLGGGEISCPIPPHTRWERGDFKYRDIVDRLARAKGSIVHYRGGASQSGVQLLSFQLGVPTLVSDAGGLPEYQPAGMSVTGIDDAISLARAMGELTDPAELDRQSRLALDHYQNHYAPEFFAARFQEILREVVKSARQ